MREILKDTIYKLILTFILTLMGSLMNTSKRAIHVKISEEHSTSLKGTNSIHDVANESSPH